VTAGGFATRLVTTSDGRVRAIVERDRARRFRRATVATLGMGGVVAGLLAVTMLIGSYALSLADVLASLLRVRVDPAVDFVVWELRLPTAVAGLGVGLALGVAGRTFQTLLRNPLASPDIVGVSSGASLAAVTAIVLFGAGGAIVSGAALIGALGSCAVVYALAWRGGIAGYRFILVGIGVAEFLLSLVAYLIARAEIYDAREAMTWLVGSLGFAGTGELIVLAATVAVALPVAVLLGRPLGAIELGDDAATALGVRVEPARLALIGVAVVLVAVATAAAGPLAFVALVAGPVAGRLLGGTSGGVVLAGLVGAAICLSADLVAEHLLPAALPTGVVTGLVGAPYLIWLLVTMNRQGRGG
jgi:iron complex transport system permease protein